jgi:CheY-like chemotaxis protein
MSRLLCPSAKRRILGSAAVDRLGEKPMTSHGRIVVVEQPGQPSGESPVESTQLLKQRLETLGHTIVATVTTTAEAAELAPRLQPDLVVIGAVAAAACSSAELDALRDRLDCPCLTIRDEADRLAPSEQVLQLRLELAMTRRQLEVERVRVENSERTNRTTARAIHEINNLLSAIRCNAFLVQSESVPAAVLEASSDITAAVERSATLITDLSGMLREQRLGARPVVTSESVPPPRTQLGSWPPRASAKDASTRNMYIVLVVDDDPVVRRAVARFVASAGYQVIESSSPEQGLAAAERYPIDLMITDLVMPNMTGYELAQRITDIRPGVRVIYMSGFAPDELVAERGRSTGPDPIFLQKPFAVDALMPSVFAMLAEDKSQGPVFGGLTSNKL